MEHLVYNSSHASANDLVRLIGTMERDEYADISPRTLFKSKQYYTPFCKRLLDFYNSVSGTCLTYDEARRAVLKSFSEKGIDISPNTPAKWFGSDYAPIYNNDGRVIMYRLAFALGLDASETVRLFNEVYLDKTCNVRNVREYVYMYCICRGKSYQEAEAIIAEVLGNEDEAQNGSMHDSVYLGQRAMETETDDEIADYILSHRSAFSGSFPVMGSDGKYHTMSDLKARAVVEELYGEDSETVKKIDIPIRGKNGLVMRERNAIRRRNKLEESIDGDTDGSTGGDSEHKQRYNTEGFLITAILSGDGSGSLTKNVKDELPREVTANFPGKDNISRQYKHNSDSLRKKIILLYFYKKWTTIKYVMNRNDISEDDCRNFYSELNAILDSCGYAGLYGRNPYDRIFIYCTEVAHVSRVNPVDILRDLLDDID